ncbi:hypothetical protein LTR60_001655 [Cryomyces antarcticus]|nr:hypothetical protein LTR60_001655 [Cryomyces antarcticus]
MDSPGRQKERRERYVVRKRYFEESLTLVGRMPTMAQAAPQVDRGSLEEEARRESLRTFRPEEKFWGRQRGWQETALIGARFIERAVPEEAEGKKAQ